MPPILTGLFFFLLKYPQGPKLQKTVSQRLLVQKAWELVRLKALDVFFKKIKKYFALPQSPLISEGIEEGLRTGRYWIEENSWKFHVWMHPQMKQKLNGVEAGLTIFLFSKNIGQELSNAPTPKSFGLIVAENDDFEILNFPKNLIFQLFINKYSNESIRYLKKGFWKKNQNFKIIIESIELV